jgi:hypothetical protein
VLNKFVQDHINRIGADQYYKLLESAMNDNIRIILALRCIIASTNQYNQDRLIISSNKAMNSSDFYGAEHWKDEIDPITGERIKIVVDEDPYKRSNDFVSKMHKKIVDKIISPPLSKLDILPSNIYDKMVFILKEYNINITSINDAYRQLDVISRKSSIENRILARISYLILNAKVNSIKYLLP